jgi:hypothetical protein
MNRKGQLLTLDLLLALVPLTIVLGMSASAIGGVINQLQDFAFFYSLQRQTNDAVDVLVKTPGVPSSWNSTNSPTTPGLAVYSCGEVKPNFLDLEKVTALDGSMISTLFSSSTNVYLEVIDLTSNTTIKNLTYNVTGTSMEDASQIFVVKRVVGIDENKSSFIVKQYSVSNTKGSTISWTLELPCGYEITNATLLVTTGGISGNEYVHFRLDKPPDPSLPTASRQRLFIGTNLVNFSWDDAYNDPSWTTWEQARSYVTQGNDHSRYPSKTLKTYLQEYLASGSNTVKINIDVAPEKARGDVDALLNITYTYPTPREGLVTMKVWR